MTEVVETIHGRRLDARYALVSKLGSGGQAEVWRAHDSVRGVDIALKVLNPSLTRNEAAWDALQHEYEISSRLSHPGILKVFAPEHSGDSIVLPMELAAGGDLRRLRGAGFLEIIPVLLQIAQALEHAHERGVVHRDLKPGNVLFDSRAQVRLADFGVAGTIVSPMDAKTGSGEQGGREPARHAMSPFTASPAQLRGEPPTPADDIYGLGALAYELLSGYPPYYPNFDRRRAIEDPVPPLVPTRQIPPLLNTLVMRMLAKDPRARPQSMREIIDELDASLNETLIFNFDEEGEPVEPASVTDSGPGAGAPASRPSVPSGPPESAAHAGTPAAATRSASAGTSRSASGGTSRPVVAAEPNRVPAAAARSTSAAQSRSGIEAPEKSARPEPAAADVRRTVLAPQRAVGTTLRTMFVSDLPAANMPEGPPQQPWGGGTGERRGKSDRRATRRIEPVFNPEPREAFETSATEARRTESRSRVASGSEEALRAASGALTETSSETATDVHERHHPFLRSSLTPREPATPGRREVGTVVWSNIPPDELPRVARLEPIRPRRWPWIVLGVLAGAAVSVYFWLPRFQSDLPPEVRAFIEPLQAVLTGGVAPKSEDAPAQTAAADAATPATGTADGSPAATAAKDLEDRFEALRKNFDSRSAALETRGAGSWGGPDFAAARARSEESRGAREAGDLPLAVTRLDEAGKLLDRVEGRAATALAAQLDAGQQALANGQQEVAVQAFTLAKRIDPNDQRAADGLRRAQGLHGILPLLADAQNAESSRDYARAAQDYSQALAIDPNNATAREGQKRANAAFADDSYARAVGAGFAALGAGRLDEARNDFNKAHALKPNGAEAADGLRRVRAGATNRGFAALRARGAALENQERWDEAEHTYEAALETDPTLGFAQEGKARAAARADLSERLQQLLDQPDRLASPFVRDQARSLLQTAQSQSPSGPVLRSQIARLQILLPGFDKPVRLSLLSDNATQVAITRVGNQSPTSRVGAYGTFSRRDISLLPGRYVVVGTRNGFRDVRREITVAPGQEVQTIKVTCSDPI